MSLAGVAERRTQYPAAEGVGSGSLKALPAAEIMLPAAEIMLPAAEIMLPAAEIMLPAAEIMLPAAEIMLPDDVFDRIDEIVLPAPTSIPPTAAGSALPSGPQHDPNRSSRRTPASCRLPYPGRKREHSPDANGPRRPAPSARSNHREADCSPCLLSQPPHYSRQTRASTHIRAARGRGEILRKGGDSNSRGEGYPPAGFQDRCIQPLCHPSMRMTKASRFAAAGSVSIGGVAE
jgi:hypothetical protein